MKRMITTLVIGALFLSLSASAASGAPAEAPACSDGVDNDGDSWTDYPKESGCESPADTTEVKEPAECEDGVDNDGDGSIDYPEDDECYAPEDRSETGLHGDPYCAFNGTSCSGMVLEKSSRKALFGAVGDPSERCMYQRSVKLKKVRPGPDRVVARFHTDSAGEFRRSRPGSAGRYYAVAAKVKLEDLVCSWRRSNVVRFRRDA